MIEAVIFDMDGVISDTQKLHAKVESELLLRYGVDLSPDEITRRYAGVKTREFFAELLDEKGLSYDIDVLIEEKWIKMREFTSAPVDCIEGALQLIKSLFDDGYLLAVASASNFDYVNSVLESLNVKDYFSCVVSGDMVKRGKPNPEIFLLAASRLGVNPESCVVIEDGISGMQAARDANMKCIGLVGDKRGSYPAGNLVLSLLEVTSDYIKYL